MEFGLKPGGPPPKPKYYPVTDSVLFLDKGKIIESGTPDEIINHPKEERTKEFFASYKRTYI